MISNNLHFISGWRYKPNNGCVFVSWKDLCTVPTSVRGVTYTSYLRNVTWLGDTFYNF